MSLPAGAYPFQITVTKTYNITNLFDDIKALYKIAGYKGQPVAFIFTDSEVKEEGFLEYINQVGHQLARDVLCGQQDSHSKVSCWQLQHCTRFCSLSQAFLLACDFCCCFINNR